MPIARSRVEVADELAHVDPMLSEQLLVNLLENAAKHTPPTSPIEVRASREPAAAIVEVARSRSRACHRAPPDQVFEKFFRGTGKRDGGCRARARRVSRGSRSRTAADRGDRSRAGGGATFRVVPDGSADVERAAGAGETAMTDRDREGIVTAAADTVLVVEDEAPMRRFLSRRAASHGLPRGRGGHARDAERLATEAAARPRSSSISACPTATA